VAVGLARAKAKSTISNERTVSVEDANRFTVPNDAVVRERLFRPRFCKVGSRSEPAAVKRWRIVDPLESREPDRGSWIGEGEVDYQ